MRLKLYLVRRGKTASYDSLRLTPSSLLTYSKDHLSTIGRFAGWLVFILIVLTLPYSGLPKLPLR